MITCRLTSLLFVAMLLSLFTTKTFGAMECNLTEASEQLVAHDDSDHKEKFSHSYTQLLSPLLTLPLSESVTPATRTITNPLRYQQRQSQSLKTTSLIDGTMTASRYGLYNHKILFVSHARQHYLLRLVRLII